MKLRAIFWNTQAFAGTRPERDNLKKAIEDFAAARHTHINQVMVSDHNNVDLQTGLQKAGIFNRMVLVLGADSLKARGVSVTPDEGTFKEALGALNHMGCIARQPVIAPEECAVITDTFEAASAAAKAGMFAICLDNKAAALRAGVRGAALDKVERGDKDVSNAAAMILSLSMQ
jgi:beta-phosphoglucomutase-like phosphatase (HAD superfamily)